MLSIIIVNYNVRDLLQSCLKSIYKFCSADLFELIVIDNASKDGSIEMIRKEFPNCTLISNTKNVGFSEANNQGMRIAKGDYLMLLNPDTELKNYALIGMLQFLKQNHEIVIIAPRLLNTDGSLQISCWKYPSVKNIILEAFFLHTIFKLDQYPRANFNSDFEVDFAIGACLLFRKELVNQIGFLDPNLFWMEDVDFCYRAKSKGKIIYYPESEIIHHSGQSLKQNYKVAISNQILSKLKYLKKHFNTFTFVIGVFFSFIHVLTRTIVFVILAPFKANYLAKFNAYFFTFKRLFNYLFLKNQTVN